MKYTSICKLGLTALLSTALSGCLLSNTNNGGGGGGGGGTPIQFADYQGNFDRVSGQAPTQDMPTRLQASYSGALRVDVGDASGNISGQVIADLDLDVDWTDNGLSPNPFTGGATNFQGTQDDGATIVAIEGEMIVDPNLPNAIVTNETTVDLPTGGTQTLQTGTMTVPLTGQLTLDGTTVDTNLLLGGTFVGPDAGGAVGSVSGGFSPVGTAPLDGIFTGGFALGTFYIEN